jgi:hypothetical protein
MPITLGDTSITGLGVGGLPAGVIQSANIASGQTFTLNGITFPSTQVASSDANTLDDYEEGSWTPTWAGSTSTGTISMASATSGKYVKIGRMVTCWAYVASTSSMSGGSGSLQIAGLPFTSTGEVSWFGHSSVGYYQNFSGYSAGNYTTILGPSASTNFVRFHSFIASGNAGSPTVSVLTGGSEAYIGCSYLTTA